MKIAVGLLEPDRRAGDAALAEEVGDQLQRLLVLVPGADFGRDASVSATDGLSKKGVTMIGSPWAGMTAAVSRSERHHWTPVK